MRIILCWPYDRKSWTTQFEALLKDQEYVFLNSINKSFEKANYADVPVYYWEDFRNADELIRQLQPDKVIFMGLDSPYTWILNFVCRQKGIPTYFYQHGIFHSYIEYRDAEKSWNENRSSAPRDNNGIADKKKQLRFFAGSYRLRRTAVFLRFISFLVIRKLSASTQKALKMTAGKSMQADRYIVYTKPLSNILRERDKVPEKKLIETGNRETNNIILTVQSGQKDDEKKGTYYLLIDEVFTGSVQFGLPPFIQKEKYDKFLFELAEYAVAKGKKLLVKLHPWSYNEKNNAEHPGIEYIREADPAELIANAYAVFGSTSTLLIPALYLKPAFLFRMNDHSSLHRILSEIQYCPIVDFDKVDRNSITFYDNNNPLNKQKFEKAFLYRVDDKCDERIRQILLS